MFICNSLAIYSLQPHGLSRKCRPFFTPQRLGNRLGNWCCIPIRSTQPLKLLGFSKVKSWKEQRQGKERRGEERARGREGVSRTRGKKNNRAKYTASGYSRFNRVCPTVFSSVDSGFLFFPSRVKQLKLCSVGAVNKRNHRPFQPSPSVIFPRPCSK